MRPGTLTSAGPAAAVAATDDLLDLAEAVLGGGAAVEDWERATAGGAALELCEDALFLCHGRPTRGGGAHGNVMAHRTSEGLVLVDAGSSASAPTLVERLRAWDAGPVRTIVLTHGHLDHAGGVAAWDEDARRLGFPLPELVAHRDVPSRHERYRWTQERRDGGVPRRGRKEPEAGGQPRVPDRLVAEREELVVGGVALELRPGRGQTDDHLWVFWPGKDLLCAGDFVTWAAPDCGSPQGVERYPLEWARALQGMAGQGPSILVPGQGPPVLGADQIQRVLLDARTLLLELHRRTLAAMNRGGTLSRVLQEVRVPRELLELPYLRPLVDDPEFMVRAIWRRTAGWYDGNPSHLKPPSDEALAREMCDLAGGVDPLLARARDLCEAGDLALAASLVEAAVLAHPDSPSAHSLRARVYAERSRRQSSRVAGDIFGGAAAESRNRSGAS